MSSPYLICCFCNDSSLFLFYENKISSTGPIEKLYFWR
jgi:hypothetical protein